MNVVLTRIEDSNGNIISQPIKRGVAYLMPGSSLVLTFTTDREDDTGTVTFPAEAENGDWEWALRFDQSRHGGDADVTVEYSSAAIQDDDSSKIDVTFDITDTHTSALGGSGEAMFKGDVEITSGGTTYAPVEFTATVTDRAGATS